MRFEVGSFLLHFQFSQSRDIFIQLIVVWYPTPIKVYISEKEIVQGIQKCTQKRHMVKDQFCCPGQLSTSARVLRLHAKEK